jgi:phosphonate transport system substrate-binding protein
LKHTVSHRATLTGVALLFVGAPALAQDDDGPLRFLRPSVEGEAEPLPEPPEPEMRDDLPEIEPELAQPDLPEPVEIPPPPEEPPAEAQAPVEIEDVPPLGEAAESLPPEIPPAEEPVPEEALSEEAAEPAADDAAAPAEALEQAAPAAIEEADQPLRLGVIAGRDVRATMAAIEPVTEGLSAALGRPVEILPMSSYGAMIDAQLLERIDGGFYSAAAFALAEARCECLEPLVAPAAEDGTVAYHAVIVTHADDGIDAVADLKGKTVAAAGADSIGGRRMQLAGLAAEGVDIAGLFGAFHDAGSSEQAVRLVVDGSADAAFAWSSLSGDLDIGYSRGTLAELAMRGEIAVEDLAIIWRSPAITHGPFAVSRSVSDADKASLEDFLLALDETAPEAYDALNPYYGGGYRSVGAEDFSGLAVLAEQDVDAIALPGPSEADVSPEPARLPD